MSISRRRDFVKFICLNCGGEFDRDEVKIFTERHGFSEGPFEKIPVCPHCNSTNFEGVDEDGEL